MRYAIQQAAGVTGNDVLTGGDGDDQVFGESGNDRMIWNPGDDTDLNEGGAGNDTVAAGAGGDWISGGDGDDTLRASGVLQLSLNGGAGADTFVLTGQQWRTQLEGTRFFTNLDGSQTEVAAGPTVITDFQAGTGGDLLERIRTEFGYSKGQLPVLIMTGDDNPQNQATLLRAGANDLVQKPIEERLLVTKLLFQMRVSRHLREQLRNAAA